LYPAIDRLSQPGGRQEILPKTTSMNRRNGSAICEMDLFSLERNSAVFMRGIRVRRQNLSEKIRERVPQRQGIRPGFAIPIVFAAVTDAKQRPGFQADPSCPVSLYGVRKLM
jgi:hypothetical protein